MKGHTRKIELDSGFCSATVASDCFPDSLFMKQSICENSKQGLFLKLIHSADPTAGREGVKLEVLNSKYYEETDLMLNPQSQVLLKSDLLCVLGSIGQGGQLQVYRLHP